MIKPTFYFSKKKTFDLQSCNRGEAALRWWVSHHALRTAGTFSSCMSQFSDKFGGQTNIGPVIQNSGALEESTGHLWKLVQKFRKSVTRSLFRAFKIAFLRNFMMCHTFQDNLANNLSFGQNFCKWDFPKQPQDTSGNSSRITETHFPVVFYYRR